MNPLRVLALAVILQASRDAGNGDCNAWFWLKCRTTQEMCDCMGVSWEELLRRTHARQRREPDAMRNFIGGRKRKTHLRIIG